VSEIVRLAPQPGPQTAFLSSRADIAIYGGAAGGGKSWALLLDPLRGVHCPHFRAAIFRRVMPSIKLGGGLLDESSKLYPGTDAELARSTLAWRWPSGARLQLLQIQHEQDAQRYKGAQITWLGRDELTEFEESQFWMLVSRVRSGRSVVQPRIRCTTNPDANSWVRRLIDWWIGPDGYPIPERSGVVRWVNREDDALVWSDEPKRGYMSITFIGATLADNPALLDADPTYGARLSMLSRVEQLKLKHGNWDASAKAGLFRDHRISRIPIRRDQLPKGLVWRRYWDLANTEPSPKNPKPDWTASVKTALHTDRDGQTLFIGDCLAVQLATGAKRRLMREVATADGYEVEIWIEHEGGSSGSEVADDYRTTHLAGWRVIMDRPSGDKVTRAGRWVGLAETGRVVIVADEQGRWPEWADALIAEIESFPWGKKDRVDAISGSYNSHLNPVFAIA